MAKISHLPLTFEDVQTAKVLNLQFDPHEGMDDHMGEEGTFEVKVEGEISEHCESGIEQVCNDVIVNVTESDSEETGDEHTHRVANLTASDFKRVEDQGQAGLQVEYRCTRCRDCVTCKGAEWTERTSLRQYAENELIKQSVVLDYESKTIRAFMPMRGPEEDFRVFV